ncbi:MAG: L,D-transpeptidase [Verrucomicrobia bacterium]|nr:L,D-transpeptidase [Verrucomicrobiota bacterium]
MKWCPLCLLQIGRTFLFVALCTLPGCVERCPMYGDRRPAWLAIFSQRCPCPQPPPNRRIIVSVEQQVMVTFENNMPKKRYPVSTSRFGLGDKVNSCLTPQGRLEVVDVIGAGLPKGALLRGRVPTGEIVRANTPGHDAIVTRILRLRGKESCNALAMKRCIYIHGTTAEKCLKKPVSWGCIRMASRDIIRLSEWAKPGTRVDIIPGRMPPPEELPQ